MIAMKLPINYNNSHYTIRKQAREEYIKLQKGLCYYCKSNLNKKPPKHITNKPVNKYLYPKNFFDHPIHLHHSHKTGMTIGAVHCYCNAVMWEYEDE